MFYAVLCFYRSRYCQRRSLLLLPFRTHTVVFILTSLDGNHLVFGFDLLVLNRMHYAFSAAALVVLQLVAQVSGAAVVAGRPTFTVRIGRCVVGGTTYDSAPTTLSGGGASASQGSSVTTSGNGGP